MRKEKINTSWQFWKEGQSEKTAVHLPHDAMILEQRQPDLEKGNATGFYPGGKYYYEKIVFGKAEYENSSVILEFEGVYMKSTVFLNGEEVGSWVYGYTNFFIDLTGKLKLKEENQILVVVDNSQTPNSRWYSGSGIYRDVNLYIGNRKHIAPDGIHIKTLSLEPAIIDVEIEASEDAEIYCRVSDTEAQVVAGNGTHLQLEIPNVKLWNAEHPHLYILEAQVLENGEVLDTSCCKFGVRQIDWNSENGLQINGETVKLRGGCLHHDHGPLGAKAYAKAERRRLTKLKHMGFNAVRYSHNPTNRGFLELCDELGLYVLEETFDQWRIAQSENDYALYFDNEWQKDIAALIHKDFSHPSVIMYCVGNEITETGMPFGADICKAICSCLKSLDSTRPTTIAVNPMLAVMAAKVAADRANGKEVKQVGSADANNVVTLLAQIRSSITAESLQALVGDTLAHVDIAGYNYGDNIYEKTHELCPERVILSSETFPKAIGLNWPMIEKTPYVIGDFMWTCWDYLGEAGVGQPVYGTTQAPFTKSYPCQSADVGAFDLTGMPEPFAFYTSIVWGQYHKPYIAVRPINRSGEDYALGSWRMTDALHSWSWAGCEGKMAHVEVYSSAATVQLLLNGKMVCERQPDACKCIFQIPYVAGTIEAVAYDTQGKETGRDALVSAGTQTMLTLCAEEKEIKADGEDLAYVVAYITDENGVCKMLDDRKVTVRVEGAGVLEAVGSACAETTERFDSNSYTTHYGRMIAIVRSNGQIGQVSVAAKVEGLPSVSVCINAV